MKSTSQPVRRALVLGLIATSTFASQVYAQAYPSRPIKFIIPFTAGSSTDIMGRALAERMTLSMGQPIIIENRPGAGGTIAAAAVAKADPDGYTVLVHSGSHAINPAIYKDLAYDTLKDFVSVAGLGSVPNILITTPGRYKNLADLVATVKAKPPLSFNYASAGIGTATHLSAEKFLLSSQLEIQHVPFKGSPEAITEVAAGRLEFYMAPINAALPLIKDGRVTALASSGSKRSPSLPEVATTLELGFPDSDFPLWAGAFLPSKTPEAIVKRLHDEFIKAANTPEVKERYLRTGTDPMLLSQPDFDAFVRKEIDIAAKIAKRAKMAIQ